MNLVSVIAKAIKEADNNYFFEDYSNQANSVIKALSNAGLIIVPKEPNESMCEAGKEAIMYGATKPTELVKKIYQSMVSSSRK